MIASGEGVSDCVGLYGPVLKSFALHDQLRRSLSHLVSAHVTSFFFFVMVNLVFLLYQFWKFATGVFDSKRLM